jgi:ribosome assembly protein 1
MPVVSPEKLIALQRAPSGVRNICILAHVDHGKTSLSDALIATNGIISPKMAGKIRYLDSRPDEQLRGITMESSAISLYFSMLRRNAPEAQPEQKEYLINLIDSPGHIDFSSEVSTASRLSDGAVVLVDAVEGVCSQTVTVLRQAWIEKLKPLLVINKMDRLITELKMTPGEAYIHLSQLLEQVNAVMGSFFLGDRMDDDLKWREALENRVHAASAKLQDGAPPSAMAGLKHTEDRLDTSTPAEYEEKNDEDNYFSPEKNNVIFSSAIDGWAFTCRQFAALWEKKLGIKRATLEKVLWGDFYLDPKTKRLLGPKHLKGRNFKPLFVQLVLGNIWAVYDATTGGPSGKGDPPKLEKITNVLSIKIPPHVLRSRDPRAILTNVFANWLPLSTALLVSVIEHLPSPSESQAARIPDLVDASPDSDFVDAKIKDAMITFKTGSDAPAVAYVSKMVAIPESELPRNKRRGGSDMTAEEAREIARQKRAEFAAAQATEEANGDVEDLTGTIRTASIDEVDDTTQDEQAKEDPEHLIGFARLYSGTLNVGDEVYVLPPKFTPAHPRRAPVPQKVKVEALYLLMGRSLESLDSVPAGVIFGIEGLAGHVLKSGTLCSTLEGGVNLAGINLGSQPIVRVALEPENPADLEKMVRGLKMLEQSDPCATYEVLESGEHVLGTAGELHLERCLKDLRERFAKCEITAGSPIVPYRETIVSTPEMNPPRDKDLPRGTVVVETSSKQVSIRLRVRPLPLQVTEFLTRNAGAIKRLYAERKEREQDDDDSIPGADADGPTSHNAESDDIGIVETGKVLSLDEFKTQLQAAFAEAKNEKDLWKDVVEHIAAFGPRRIGPNLLVDKTEGQTCGRLLQDHAGTNGHGTSTLNGTASASNLSNKIIYAFQLASFQGPLCNEPIQGVAVFLESITVSGDEDLSSGRVTSEILRMVRSAISTGFLDWSPRILLAMYSVEITTNTEALGRVYQVLSRRRGHVLEETLSSGTSDNYTILALLPVAESFGFAEEIRKRTSGAAQPQLRFAGFELLSEWGSVSSERSTGEYSVEGDPGWVPRSEEELEDLGVDGDKENVAKRYVDRVRGRKGLRVEGRKLVRDAEKQKTLKR